MARRPYKLDLESAFAFHVRKTKNCWLWTGPTFKYRGGYGVFTMRSEGIIMARAHRVSWTLHRGPINSDDHVLHTCDNPLCVNPKHLFLGDQQTNMDDKVSKGRQNRGERHGMHKLTEKEAIAIRLDDRKYTKIAKFYGVSVATICDIKAARSWSHLGKPVGRYAKRAN